MNDTADLLQIKIEEAKRKLPLETINAINAVDWKAAILGLRTKKGYTFEQLGDLELETELLLAGLTNTANYPKELEKRMEISKSAVDELVKEMNNLVFKKIREELIKNTERKKAFQKDIPSLLDKEEGANNAQVLKSAGIEIIENKETLPVLEKLELTTTEKPVENREDILQKIEKPELITTKEEVHPILMQKLSGSFQIPTIKTDHTLQNLSSGDKESIITTKNAPNAVPKVDPYRMPIDNS